MIDRRSLFVLTLACGFVNAAPAPKEKPLAPSIVGDWEGVRSVEAGMPAAADKAVHRQKYAADGTWSYSYGEMVYSPTGMTFATNREAKPATFDIYSPKNRPSVYRGIYKIEGDTLTMCLVVGDGIRPTEFVSSAKKPTQIWVFKRIKPKE